MSSNYEKRLMKKRRPKIGRVPEGWRIGTLKDERINVAQDRARTIVSGYRSQAPEGHDPQAAITTAALIIAAITIAAAASSYSAYSSAQAQRDSARYNQAVAKNNATAAAQQAQYEADRIRERNRHILGQQRANLSKSGVDLSGSGADLAMDSAIQGELDVLASIYTGRISSGSAEAQSQLFAMQARQAGKAQTYGTVATATGTLAGGATSVASSPSFRGQ